MRIQPRMNFSEIITIFSLVGTDLRSGAGNCIEFVWNYNYFQLVGMDLRSDTGSCSDDQEPDRKVAWKKDLSSYSENFLDKRLPL